jgi:hypothetical protein
MTANIMSTIRTNANDDNGESLWPDWAKRQHHSVKTNPNQIITKLTQIQFTRLTLSLTTGRIEPNHNHVSKNEPKSDLNLATTGILISGLISIQHRNGKPPFDRDEESTILALATPNHKTNPTIKLSQIQHGCTSTPKQYYQHDQD